MNSGNAQTSATPPAKPTLAYGFRRCNPSRSRRCCDPSDCCSFHPRSAATPNARCTSSGFRLDGQASQLPALGEGAIDRPAADILAVNGTLPNRADMPNPNLDDWVKPQQLADVIVVLLSKQASAIIGALIPVTGRLGYSVIGRQVTPRILSRRGCCSECLNKFVGQRKPSQPATTRTGQYAQHLATPTWHTR